jgi:hypothetical protein
VDAGGPDRKGTEMAVTIDEMHVEVQESPPVANSATAAAQPKKDLDLNQAIEILRERNLRLRAD